MKIENDRAIFRKGYPGIVPFLMEEYRGKVSFEVYAGIRSLAETFQKRYEGRYFSKDALTFIASGMDPYLQKNGYERDTVGMTLYYYHYEMTPSQTPDLSLILDNTYRLCDLPEAMLCENLTTFSLRDLLERSLESFVTVEDGKVVAIATVNERLESGTVPEITVETAPAYRRRGYALSCVAALCDYLLKKGSPVAYCCRNTHTKSNRVAKRVGFVRVGRFYAVSAYRSRQN
ncbi:MAG: GNAT family N-acetyltransferase [Clostridia bacterium]|nr:GNAT family N-acetyltransferase [Clostridia bacterium]